MAESLHTTMSIIASDIYGIYEELYDIVTDGMAPEKDLQVIEQIETYLLATTRAIERHDWHE